jgi:hypothetical protein
MIVFLSVARPTKPETSIHTKGHAGDYVGRSNALSTFYALGLDVNTPHHGV